MSKEIMITDSTCYGYWDKGTYKERCTYDSDSIGIGPISIVLGFIIILILIFKKNSSNSSVKSTSNLLEKYVLWYQNNKDDSASIGNSYLKGNFFIVKDKNGTILNEVTKDNARQICSREYNLIDYQDVGNYEEYKLNQIKRFQNYIR